MPAKTTLWPRGDHTKGKHLVLREYLKAWLPIMGRTNARILFIDGFAGPGEYDGGEDGSPIVALRCLMDHHAKATFRAEIKFLFIEKDVDRAAHLESLVTPFRTELPPSAEAHVFSGKFDQSMSAVLDQLDAQRKILAPAFVMIDPFGVSGTPMEVIARILENPKSEVYISFMSGFINRFLGAPEYERHLDELFGTGQWRDGINLEGDERLGFLYQLYRDQLKACGAEHVIHFDLRRRNQLVYTIFFGTHHSLGCDRMKQAVWKVAPFGDFSFRGTKQLMLGVETPDYARLREVVLARFRGTGWVTIDEVMRFVESDATLFHTGQVKTPVLKPLEQESLIEVDPSSRKRPLKYPPGTRLRFLEDAEGPYMRNGRGTTGVLPRRG